MGLHRPVFDISMISIPRKPPFAQRSVHGLRRPLPGHTAAPMPRTLAARSSGRPPHQHDGVCAQADPPGIILAGQSSDVIEINADDGWTKPRAAAGGTSSVARGEAKPTSEIDILIELEPDLPIDLFEYIGITQYLADIFPIRVDVANLSKLKPHFGRSAEHDAVYAL